MGKRRFFIMGSKMGDELALKLASGEIGVDLNRVVDRTCGMLSGARGLIGDQLVKDAYIGNLARDIIDDAGTPERIRERLREDPEELLDDFFNYMVHAGRLVRMRVDGTGESHVATPPRFGEMVERAGIAPEKRAALVEDLKRVALKDESVSKGGISAERLKPIGPTPRNPLLSRLYGMVLALPVALWLAMPATPQAAPASASASAIGMQADGEDYGAELLGSVFDTSSRMAYSLDPSAPPNTNRLAKESALLQDAHWEKLSKSARKFLELLEKRCEGKSLAEKLEFVNQSVNQWIKYRSDEENYGKKDYWAPVHQSLSATKGDCEDYAIAKYQILKRLGLADDAGMRVIIVKDRQQDNAGHAVLGVFQEDGVLVLDNLSDKVMTQKQLRGRYTAHWSLNANSSWMHSMDRKMTAEYNEKFPVRHPVPAASKAKPAKESKKLREMRAKLPSTSEFLKKADREIRDMRSRYRGASM